MIHAPEWLVVTEGEFALGIAPVTVLLLSLTAVVVARALRFAPAIRESLLLWALAACLAAPLITAVVHFSGKPIVALRWDKVVRPERPAFTEFDPADGISIVTSDATSADQIDEFELRLRLDSTDDIAAETAATTISTKSSPVPKPASSKPVVTRPRIKMLLVVTWVLGTCLFAGFAVRSFYRAHRIRLCATRPRTSRYQVAAEASATIVGLKKTPTVLESFAVSSPVVVGFQTPTVVLPPWVGELVSEIELREIFIHEFAHIRRRDSLVICVQAVARCLFWPIVTIHWLNRELAQSREEVCDNFVLAHVDAIAYGELLAQLAERAIGVRPIVWTTGILNWQGELESRVVSMLDPRTSRATRASQWINLLLASAFLSVGIAFCGTRFVTAQSATHSVRTNDRSNSTANEIEPRIIERRTNDSIGDPLPTGALLRMGTLRLHHSAIVADLALSPNEETIVTIGEQLIAWNTKTGAELWRAQGSDFGFEFRGPRYGSHEIAFSSDSSHFYTAGGNNQVVIWETTSGNRKTVNIQTPVKAKKGFFIGSLVDEQQTKSVDVTQDGQLIAAGCGGGLVVCDQTGKVRFRIANVHKKSFKSDNIDRLNMFGEYSTGRFSPDGKVLAVVTSDRPEEIRLYDVATGSELRTVKLASKLVRMNFSPDGKQIVATERDSAVRLYEVETGQRIWSKVFQLTHAFENYTSAIAFSPNAKIIAVCATDKRIRLLDAATGDETGQFIGHRWYPWALAFTSNGQMLYSSGWDGAIRRWDVATRKQLDLPDGFHGSGVVAASPDGKTLAYQDDSGTVRFIAAEDGAELRKLAVEGMIFSQLLFSPDGRHLAGGGFSGDQVQVVVWEVKTGERLHSWNWPQGRDPNTAVESLSFTPDGRRLAAAVFRQSVAYVWDIPSGEKLAGLKHKEIFGLSFSPDGTNLATAGWDSNVRFWETETWKMSREFEMPNSDKPDNKDGKIIDPRMVSVCYAPYGGLVATAHLDGMVRVWQADDLLLRAEFKVEWLISQGNVTFSPDGLWLATGAKGGEVELWDPSTGRKVWLAGKHQNDACILGFGRDNRTLVSGGEDRISYLWDLRPSQLPTDREPLQLWNAVTGDDPAAAYQAMWALCDDSNRTVALLAGKLRPVRTIFDLDHVDKTSSSEESQSQKRMRKILADKDPKIETAITVRRCICVLEQLRTPAAVQLLKELAVNEQVETISQYANAALIRLNVIENR